MSEHRSVDNPRPPSSGSIAFLIVMLSLMLIGLSVGLIMNITR